MAVVMISSVVELVAPALVVLAAVRIALRVRPLPGNELPDPAALGLPMAGPASQQAAHAALSRKHPGWTPPKFRT
jgi:hypothetical protein